MIEQIDLAGSFTLPGTSLTAKRMGCGAATEIVNEFGRPGLGRWMEVRTNA
jgi:hypothetical protein